MKVYIVMSWELSGEDEMTQIREVFANKEYAEKYIKENRGHPANNDWWISEWEVKAMPKNDDLVEEWYKQGSD